MADNRTFVKVILEPVPGSSLWKRIKPPLNLSLSRTWFPFSFSVWQLCTSPPAPTAPGVISHCAALPRMMRDQTLLLELTAEN